ncbi:hypothetical protein AN403_6024 [Pseudomonas fluorescens]|uniref:Uncharacterized protein n=1 Tax=Pseudomonas fluorescens TaxID=294 RepID=A0A0P9BFK6_PSEFL|nr:hypothetical protein AN403_6024 [Pseudomonas fluorescens]
MVSMFTPAASANLPILSPVVITCPLILYPGTECKVTLG